jgi:archaellum component FlaC
MNSSLPISEVATGAGVLVLREIVQWIAGRGRVRNDTFTTVMGALQARLEHTENRLDRVEGEHDNCEKSLRELGIRLDESEHDRVELRREIDRLMGGPVAGYKPRMPK